MVLFYSKALIATAVLAAIIASATSDSCPESWAEISGRCFTFESEFTKSWFDGNTTCADMGGYLAQVDACGLLGDIAQYIDETEMVENADYWIGGTDLDQEGHFVWLDGSNVSMAMPFWGKLDEAPEPSGGLLQNCISLAAADRHYFHDTECAQALPVLCETDAATTTEPTATTDEATATDVVTTDDAVHTDDAATTDDAVTTDVTITADDAVRTIGKDAINVVAASCPPDYTTISGQCFLIMDDAAMAWTEAKEVCAGSGGYLATMDDCAMLADTAAHLTMTDLVPELGYWIGANDRLVEGVFRWEADDTKVSLSMTFWGSTQGVPEPNGLSYQNCVAMYSGDRFFFHDFDCAEQMAVLCQATPN